MEREREFGGLHLSSSPCLNMLMIWDMSWNLSVPQFPHRRPREGSERQIGDQDRAVLPNSGITWFREGVVSSVKLCRGGGDA